MAEEPGQENRDAPSNEDKPSRRRLIGLAIAGAILLVVFLWVWVHPTDPTEKKDFIQAVGVLLAALAALGGLYFTRTSTKDQLEQARKSQEQTQRLTEQGQITDRFTRAIDQLGKVDENNNKLFEIRIGGIYALERIARESEEDYDPIMEVLAAYVRQNAPLKPGKETAEEESDKEERTPDPDIQAITTVLRRLTRLHGQGQPGSLNLHDTDLYRVNLQGAYLYEADLRGADLQEADLQEAYLYGADLRGADLPKANLREAYLYGADLRGADLQKANLQGANLQEANVTDEQLASTLSLQGATMPHGQEDEDWIKDKEGGGKDVENE
jgi:hypothetical protein